MAGARRWTSDDDSPDYLRGAPRFSDELADLAEQGDARRLTPAEEARLDAALDLALAGVRKAIQRRDERGAWANGAPGGSQ